MMAVGLFIIYPDFWRLWMLFYGSLFVALGSILFSWQCPLEIKQYASAFSFVDAQRPHFVAHHWTKKIVEQLKTLYKMSSWQNSIFSLDRFDLEHPNLGS